MLTLQIDKATRLLENDYGVFLQKKASIRPSRLARGKTVWRTRKMFKTIEEAFKYVDSE